MANDDPGCCTKCFRLCMSCCCLLGAAAISFWAFDLGGAVTGGVFTNIGTGLTETLSSSMGAGGGALGFLLNGLLGLAIIVIFPLHWMLQYRPDQPMYALAMMIPWIICVGISAYLWDKNLKAGFMRGIKIATCCMVPVILIFIVVIVLLGRVDPAVSLIGSSFINGMAQGLTDLPFVAAVILACLEGGIIGGLFGALAGAIRYNPNATSDYTPNQPTFGYGGGSGGQSYSPSPAYAPPTSQTTKPGSSVFCTKCGAPIAPDEQFCTECGNKRP